MAYTVKSPSRKAGGKSGVAAADYLKRLKSAETEGEGHTAAVQIADGTRFYAVRELWVDERFD